MRFYRIDFNLKLRDSSLRCAAFRKTELNIKKIPAIAGILISKSDD